LQSMGVDSSALGRIINKSLAYFCWSLLCVFEEDIGAPPLFSVISVPERSADGAFHNIIETLDTSFLVLGVCPFSNFSLSIPSRILQRRL